MFSSSPLLSAPRFSQVTLVNQYNCEGLGAERTRLLKAVVERIQSMRDEYPGDEFIVTLKERCSWNDSLAAAKASHDAFERAEQLFRDSNPEMGAQEIETRVAQAKEQLRQRRMQYEQFEENISEDRLPHTSLPFYLSFKNSKNPSSNIKFMVGVIADPTQELRQLYVAFGQIVRNYLNALYLKQTPE